MTIPNQIQSSTDLVICELAVQRDAALAEVARLKADLDRIGTAMLSENVIAPPLTTIADHAIKCVSELATLRRQVEVVRKVCVSWSGHQMDEFRVAGGCILDALDTAASGGEVADGG